MISKSAVFNFSFILLFVDNTFPNSTQIADNSVLDSNITMYDAVTRTFLNEIQELRQQIGILERDQETVNMWK
jgi:hypothetical protein